MRYIAELQALHSNKLFHLHHIPFSTKNKDAYRQMKIETNSLLLVRPDAYIIYKTDDISLVNIEQYLQDMLRVC